MKNPLLNRILAVTNILILAIICSDAFFLPPQRTTQIFDYYSSAETKSSETSSHWSNFIHTRSGLTLREPPNTEKFLQPGDSFYAEKSRLFKRPLRLVYLNQTGNQQINNGSINEGGMGILLILFILIISLINTFPVTIIKRINLNERLIFSAAALLCILLLFYFL